MFNDELYANKCPNCFQNNFHQRALNSQICVSSNQTPNYLVGYVIIQWGCIKSGRILGGGGWECLHKTGSPFNCHFWLWRFDALQLNCELCRSELKTNFCVFWGRVGIVLSSVFGFLGDPHCRERLELFGGRFNWWVFAFWVVGGMENACLSGVKIWINAEICVL